MYNQSILAVSLLSLMAILPACSSSGTNKFIESLTETPLVSKPLDAQGLQEQAKKNVEVVAKRKLGGNLDELKSSNYEISIGDKTYTNAANVDLKDLGANNTIVPTVTVTDIKEKFDVGSTKNNNHEKLKVESNRKAYLYQQQYSIVGMLERRNHTIDGKVIEKRPCFRDCDDVLLTGEMTKTLPTAGKANYTGVAWTRNTVENSTETPAYTMGSLSYDVDFDEKTGSGTINGANNFNDITLEKANIEKLSFRNPLDGKNADGSGIFGKAKQGDTTGKYQLGFFGDKAQEIAGTVDLKEDGNVDVAFSGAKKQ